jgi:hypothetical protein
MIKQGFGFTRHFLKEWNNRVYFRRCTGRYKCRERQEKVRPVTGREAGLGHAGSELKKMPCGFKDQARARQSREKCGLI